MVPIVTPPRVSTAGSPIGADGGSPVSQQHRDGNNHVLPRHRHRSGRRCGSVGRKARFLFRGATSPGCPHPSADPATHRRGWGIERDRFAGKARENTTGQRPHPWAIRRHGECESTDDPTEGTTGVDGSNYQIETDLHRDRSDYNYLTRLLREKHDGTTVVSLPVWIWHVARTDVVSEPTVPVGDARDGRRRSRGNSFPYDRG